MNFEMKPIFVDYHKGHGWFFFRFLCKLKVFLSVFPIWINNSTVFCWLAHPWPQSSDYVDIILGN